MDRNFDKEVYFQKVQFLTAHYSRMWTRFNFFLVINSAFFGLTFDSSPGPYVPLISCAGVILSLTWYFFAATDNQLSSIYRSQVEEAYLELTDPIAGEENVRAPKTTKDLPFVGNPNYFPMNSKYYARKNSLLSFRFERFSVTEMGVTFAAFFCVLWIVILAGHL